MNGHAEYVAPAMHEFRAVSVPASTFRTVADELGGNPGVARCSLHGEKCLIEFYDMRDAQHFATSVPESTPQPYAPDCSEQVYEGRNDVMDEKGALGAGPGRTLGPGAPHGQRSLRRLGAEKYTKFDIVLARIQEGKDIRTTVMIRNLPKWFTEDDVLEFLRKCKMTGRFDFFHMPQAKRGAANQHCGFAFVNCLLPQDVQHFYLCAQAVAADHYKQFMNKKSMGLSYARFQCHAKFVHQSPELADGIRLLMNNEASSMQKCTESPPDPPLHSMLAAFPPFRRGA